MSSSQTVTIEQGGLYVQEATHLPSWCELRRW